MHNECELQLKEVTTENEALSMIVGKQAESLTNKTSKYLKKCIENKKLRQQLKAMTNLVNTAYCAGGEDGVNGFINEDSAFKRIQKNKQQILGVIQDEL